MKKNPPIGDSKKLKEEYDYLAPDNSEIRNLLDMTHVGLAHCTLPPNSKSDAVKHRTVEEIWYFIEGFGNFGGAMMMIMGKKHQ